MTRHVIVIAAALLTVTTSAQDFAAHSGLDRHLAALQEIADQSNGNRAAGTKGYDRSVDYVRRELEGYGYRVQDQLFTYDGIFSRNLLAEMRSGDPLRVVMVGAHLDSVLAGPGINDNASGVAVALEVARQAMVRQPQNRVRIAFWGAEEMGLIGSRVYLNSLPRSEQARIVAYINLDMLASPNGGHFIIDDPEHWSVRGAFEDHFRQRGIPTRTYPAEVMRRTDAWPFIQAGIPTSGVASGADGHKDASEASAWGGAAGMPYDANYHTGGDVFGNTSNHVFSINADAVMNVVARLAGFVM